MESSGEGLPEIRARFDEEPLREQTMSSILENRAVALGSRAFVHYGPDDRTVSFEELNNIANSVGNGLVSAGVNPGNRISVMMRHPLETLFAMFGIHKAGGVYSPINFEYRGMALSYQLNDTDPEFLFLEDRYTNRLNEIRGNLDRLPTIVTRETAADSPPLDDAFRQLSFTEFMNRSTDRPDYEASWSDEASIVYTSGTTGDPKGVVLPHRWIFANYTLVFAQILNESDVVHTSLPLYHVGGVYTDTTAALIAGAKVSQWDRFSPQDFWDRIEKYGATRTVLLSVMMPWLVKQAKQDDDYRNTLKAVHMQPLPDNYDELAERFGFDIITAGFGQTESGYPLSGVIHANPGGTPRELLKGKPPDDILSVAERLGMPVVDSISEDRYMGKELFFMDAKILDENDEEAPRGDVGELAFRPKGPGLILKEYFNKPDRTAEAWRNLWFHTGDAAYQDADGNFYFVDRLGDVIRRRGENISSMQIQDTITAQKDVGKAAVFPIEAPEGGEDQIGAAIEPVDPEMFSEEALARYLDENLPEFMHPDEILIVDKLPTTETNKIEKYRLRQQLERE